MKIASSSLKLDSSHTKQQSHEIRESLRIWNTSSRLEISAGATAQTLSTANPVLISDAGKSLQSTEANAIEQGIDAAENDPMLKLIRSMIALLTGRDVRIFDASELSSAGSSVEIQDPNQSSQSSAAATSSLPAGYSGTYDRHETYSETEQTTFDATGVVRTADGKEINFDLSLSMQRSYHEESDVSIRLGDAQATKDPLVINFSGSAAQLSSQRFKFDLDSDGQTDNINFVTGGSGFLALDRNGDGKINNGSELFGAKSGDGFADLAALDSDNNGWIDENDAAYAQLRVWTKDGNGNDQLATLKQAHVGAISLARTDTSFDLKDSTNALLGQIRASGVFLQETGMVGSVQQVDLTV